jgi:hypothetical protein
MQKWGKTKGVLGYYHFTAFSVLRQRKTELPRNFAAHLAAQVAQIARNAKKELRRPAGDEVPKSSSDNATLRAGAG